MKDNNTQEKRLHEALDLMNSEKSEVFMAELTDSVASALARAKGEKEAYVESATNLTDVEKQQLEQVLKGIFKKQMQTKYTIHAYLLGGFKIRVGDWKLDTTLLHQLETMKNVISGGE